MSYTLAYSDCKNKNCMKIMLLYVIYSFILTMVLHHYHTPTHVHILVLEKWEKQRTQGEISFSQTLTRGIYCIKPLLQCGCYSTSCCHLSKPFFNHIIIIILFSNTSHKAGIQTEISDNKVALTHTSWGGFEKPLLHQYWRQ